MYMRQQAEPLTESHVSLLVMFLFLVLAISFLAIVNVQTTFSLPYEKIPVAFLIGGIMTP